MPDNITKMLKDNYKKIAIVNPNIDLPKDGNGVRNFRIPINLQFTPSLVYIECSMPETEYETRYAFGSDIGRYYSGYDVSGGKIIKITKDYVDIELRVNLYNKQGDYKIFRLVAIE